LPGGPVARARRRILIARGIAIIADAVQIVLLPVFAGGAASPMNNALDVAVGITMTALVGWHWVFLPAFVTEIIPMVDLAPTWTIAVFIATRQRGGPSVEDRSQRSSLSAPK
ncbi:MAG: hypothetical protein Q8K55_12805, partial [Gemmatimonadaceae bacterium]|nr:hypothetical protein [Gemmatimonadaceae bacterium]